MVPAFVSTSRTTDVTAAGPARTQLRVGRLVKAHGLKGALKLELYTDDPDRRFVPGAVFTLQVPESSPWHGKTLTVREFRWMNSHPVVFFEDVDDRSVAESIVRAILWIDQDDAPSDEDDAWYDHQLVGLTVLRDGDGVGRVIRVEHLPAQDLLVVRPHSTDAEILVPFVAAIVPEVDVAGGTVTVTPPPGLFEDLPGDDGDDTPPTERPDGDDERDSDAPSAAPPLTAED